MESILQEFAYGNINPSERSFKKETEYNKSAKKLLASETELLASLDEKQKALYESFSVAQREFCTISETERFVSAFKLGSRIMLEVMSGDLQEIQ